MLSSENRKAALLAVLFFGAALLCWSLFLGVRPFSTRGEGREALVVQGIAQQNNFVLPRRNGAIPSKPPMFHWMAYGSARAAGGIDEFSIRLPSLVCAALALLVSAAAVWSMAGLSTAAAVVALLASTFEWNRSATHARVDMCFAFFLIIAHFSLFRFLQPAAAGVRRPPAAWLLLSCAGCIGAVLAKGPTGLIIPWACAGVYFYAANHWSLRRSVGRLPIMPLAAAIVISAAIPAVWYVLAYADGGQDFLNVQLLKENAARIGMVDTEEVGHEQPFFFSVIHLVLGFLPWSLMFPAVGVWFWTKRREVFGEPLLQFSAVWVAFYILAVSLSVSKRTVYLLPAYPAAAYITARCLLDAASPALAPRTWRFCTLLLFGGSCVVLSAAAAGLLVLFFFPWAVEALSFVSAADRANIAAGVQALHELPLGLLLVALAAACSIYAARLYRRAESADGLYWYAAGCLALVFALNAVFLPAEARTKSPRLFMEQVLQALPDGAPLYQYKHEFYAAVFYAGRHMPPIENLSVLPKGGDAYVIISEKDREQALSEAPAAALLLKSLERAANGQAPLLLFKITPDAVR